MQEISQAKNLPKHANVQPPQPNTAPGGGFLHLFSYVNTMKFLGTAGVIAGLYNAYAAYNLIYSSSTTDPEAIGNAVAWAAAFLIAGGHYMYEGFRLEPIHRENAELAQMMDTMTTEEIVNVYMNRLNSPQQSS